MLMLELESPLVTTTNQVHNFKLAVLDATRIDGIPLLSMMPPADRDLFARRRSRRDLGLISA